MKLIVMKPFLRMKFLSAIFGILFVGCTQTGPKNMYAADANFSVDKRACESEAKSRYGEEANQCVAVLVGNRVTCEKDERILKAMQTEISRCMRRKGW